MPVIISRNRLRGIRNGNACIYSPLRCHKTRRGLTVFWERYLTITPF
jgi:hypothetical protein